MSKKLSLSNLQIRGKRVLMRVDYNVPLDSAGNIVDDTRIQSSLPSIHYVLDHGGSLILMSHLGRPKNGFSKDCSLQPCAKRLSELLHRPVMMAEDCIGAEVVKKAQSLKPGDILMLENLRFHIGEEHPEKDQLFAQLIAQLGDLYVNDAFGTAHRTHSSTASIANYFPGKAASGLLLEKEIECLDKLLQDPARPFCAVIGGAKISGKLGVLKSLLPKINVLLIGGAMSFTFLKALGKEVGNSLVEENMLEEAKLLLAQAEKLNVPIILPQDHLIAEKIAGEAAVKIVNSDTAIPKGWQGVDIGPETIQTFIREIKKSKTVLWNGPLGIFEIPAFANGTFAIARAIAESGCTSVVGGGDSIAALKASGMLNKITHVSTGGGASLEYIEFGSLPGIDALSPKEESLFFT